MPLVSIISVNYNQLELTLEMLESVESNSFKNLEVIVVDNGSVIDPSEAILKNFPKTKVVRSEKNLGFAGGNNLGIEQSSGDFLFFLNNDAVLTDGVIERLLLNFKTTPRLGIISPKICHWKNSEKDADIIQYCGATPVSAFTGRNKTLGEGAVDFGQFEGAHETAYVHGAAMMTSRKVIEKAGMMPEDFFLYYEELDWCEQIKKAGFKIGLEPAAKIYHKESVSIGKESPLKTFYLNRNRILFMRRNFGFQTLSIFAVYLLLIGIPKNVVAHLWSGNFSNLKAYLRAVGWHLKRPFLNTKKQPAKPQLLIKNEPAMELADSNF